VELRHLRYFVAVAEEQNVTRAAARLHVSQPPLSRQIQDLEAELGFDLFERSARAIRLTPAGKVFLKEARDVLRRVEDAVAAARAVAAGAGGDFHLGYAPSPTAEIMPAVLRSFGKNAPGWRTVLHDMATPEMIAGLRDGRLQAALMVKPPRPSSSGIVFEPLRRFPIVVAVPPGHSLARRPTVTMADALAQPQVVYSREEFPDFHQMLRQMAGPLVKRLRIAEECDGVMSLIAAIESGKGVALIANSLAHTAGKRLRYVPVDPPPAPAVVGVAYRAGKLDATRRAFLEAARGAAKATPE
jgi:DNA-binding transcriptional LysR family regulator